MAVRNPARTRLDSSSLVNKQVLARPVLVGADDESDGELDSEEDHHEVVEQLDDENHPGIFNVAKGVLQNSLLKCNIHNLVTNSCCYTIL